MKKVFHIFLVGVLTAAMIFTLVSCGESNTTTSTVSEETTASHTVGTEKVEVVSFTYDKENERLKADTEELLAFTAEIESNVELANEDVKLLMVDETGDESRYVMTDNGDGIYTCKLSINSPEPTTMNYYVEVKDEIKSDAITVKTHKDADVSADELGITSGELSAVIDSLNLDNIEGIDEQLEEGAATAFEPSDTLGFSYTIDTYNGIPIVIWSVDTDDYAEYAERVISGDSYADMVWESVRALAVASTELIDSIIQDELEYEDYHSVTALLNRSDSNLLLLAVYDGEIIYDVTEEY